MNSDQVEGTARETVGRLREDAGAVLGDDVMQGRGKLDQATGAIQHGYGRVVETMQSTADGSPVPGDVGHAVRKLGRQIASTLHDTFGDAAPTYMLAGAITFLGAAILWAGRDRD